MRSSTDSLIDGEVDVDENSLLETLQRNKEPILSYLSTFLTVGKKRLSMPVTWQSFPLKSSQVTSQFPPSQVKSQFSGIGNSSKLGMGWGRSPILFLSTAAVWSLSWYPWNWLFTFPVSRHFHFVPYGQISYSLVNIFLFVYFLSRYDLVYQLLNILRKWIWSFRYDFTKRKQTVLLCINLLIPLGFLTVRLFVCFNTILMKMCTIKLTCYRSPNLFKKMIGSF